MPRLLADAAAVYNIQTTQAGFSYTPGILAEAAGAVFYSVTFVAGSQVITPLKRLPLDGGAPTVVPPPVADSTGGYYVFPNAVVAHWITPGDGGALQQTLYSGPVDGAAPTSLIAQASRLGGVISDGANLYWQDDQGLATAPLDGGEVRRLSTLGQTVPVPYAELVGIVGSTLILVDAQAGYIDGVPIDGGPDTPLVTGIAGLAYAGPCGDSVCWFTNDDAGTMPALMMAQPGATPVQLAPPMVEGEPYLLRLVTDGVDLYALTASEPGFLVSVVRIPRDGGSSSDVVDTFGPAGEIAVDDNCIYWMDNQGVVSVAKSVTGPIEEPHFP